MIIFRKKIESQNLENIKKQLLELGMNPSTDGIWFWTIAINFVRKDKNLAIKMTDMYKKIAKYCKTDMAKVERNMRTSLAPIRDVVGKTYNYNGKIDNKTFLSLCNYINIDWK